MARRDIKCNVPAIINFSKQSASNYIEWKIQDYVKFSFIYHCCFYLNLCYAAIWIYWIMRILRPMHLICRTKTFLRSFILVTMDNIITLRLLAEASKLCWLVLFKLYNVHHKLLESKQVQFHFIFWRYCVLRGAFLLFVISTYLKEKLFHIHTLNFKDLSILVSIIDLNLTCVLVQHYSCCLQFIVETFL